MRFQILGPIRVEAAGREVTITASRDRILLGMLLLYANQPVTVDRLIDAIWPASPPRDARNQLQGCVSRLRRRLSDAGIADQVIVTEPAGYRAVAGPDDLDLLVFRRLVAEARVDAGKGRHEEARAGFRAALALWRGPALAGITPLIVGLEEERAQALEECLDVEVTAGAGSELVAELTDLVRQHPHREGLHRALMLALYRAGRQADALAAYRHARQLLHDELGIEPGSGLQQLHQAILNRDPALDAAPAPTAPPVLVPRQLPSDVAGFTGRDEALKALDELLGRRPDATGPVVISAIAGTAGIGKTALAVRWAHTVAHWFPDGQLFIDLHGYTQGVKPVEPTEVLDRMLRTLGIPGPQIPASLDERGALYRTRLADQRMLIVLDNAATETQVAPLIPGAPGCLVLVTSRRRLAGLDNAHVLSLDVLSTLEAVMLFTRTAGEHSLAGQPPELLTELVELCGWLPLAIRIAAARLHSHPTWRLDHLVQRLRDQQHRLGELTAGHRSVTAALDLSYQHLSADEQQAYRLLGLHPGPEFDDYATAALLDSTLPSAGRVLDQLLDAHLLQEPTPGRYRFHDLTRVHAAHTATADQAASTSAAALDRLLDHYRHAAASAMDTAYPYEREDRPQVPSAHTPSPELPDPAKALAWLDTALPNLLAAAWYAAEHSRPAHILHLSTILHRHLRNRSRYHDANTLHQHALVTARVTGHQVGELEALTSLGHIHTLLGRHEQAADHYQQALQLARATGHRPGELNALTSLGHIHTRLGRREQATGHFGQALQLARATGHRPGELIALTGLGNVHRRLGRHAEAADHFGQALQLARATGHRPGELNALTSLGHIHTLQGRHAQAADHFGQALQLARATGHRPGELNALTSLGQIRTLQGRHAQAADHYQELLELAQARGDLNYEYEARQGLGRLQHATGHPDTAITHHQQALALASELSQPEDQARAHDGLAHAYHALNQHEQARQHWQDALDILISVGIDHTDDEQTTNATIRAHLAALAAR